MPSAPDARRLQADLDALMRRLTNTNQRDLVAAWALAWDDISADLIAALADAYTPGTTVSATALRQSARLQVVLDQVLARLEELAAATAAISLAPLRQLVQAAGAAQARIIAAQLPAVQRLVRADSWERVDRRQVDAIVIRATQAITSAARPLSSQADHAIRAELIRAVAVGSNPKVTARRVVARAKDGFAGGLPRAMTIARTEQLDAHRNAAALGQAQHADVLDGWVWDAALTPRTCPACLSMHGREFPLTQAGPEGHPNCRCGRIPKTKSWADLGFDDIDEPPPLLADADEYFASLAPEQQKALLGPGKYQAWLAGDFPREQWAELRHSDGWRDSWVNAKTPRAPASAGGSGNGTPPRAAAPAGTPDPEPHRGFGPPPPPADRKASAEYWARRAAALEGDAFTGASLLREPQEVRFVERMLDRGQSMDWIPADRRRGKTNDFLWRELGVEVELKTNKPRYRTIAGAIRSDVPPKSHFILDLEDQELTQELAWQLEKYNLRNPGNKILQLWVLSEDGKELKEIPL